MSRPEGMAGDTVLVCLQKGRLIEKVTSVIDLENLSYHRHYYWPAIQMFREVCPQAVM